MAMSTLQFKMTGTRPLLLHNERLADPADPIAREMKTISGKRKKTDDDYARMADVEWIGGMYFTDSVAIVAGKPVTRGVPAVKTDMIEAMLTAAAKAKRLGKTFSAAVMCESENEHLEIQYSGPKSMQELMADPRFRKKKGVRVGQAKVMRTRPRFAEWAIEGVISYNREAVNESDIKAAFEHAGMMIGLGDWRPKHGTFTVEFPKD